MPFPPLPEGCGHRATLKQAVLRVAISITMVCLFVFQSFNTFSPMTAFVKHAMYELASQSPPHDEQQRVLAYEGGRRS